MTPDAGTTGMNAETDAQYYERKRSDWHDARHDRAHAHHGPGPYTLDLWARRSRDFGWRGALRFPTACGDLIFRVEIPPGGLRCWAQDPIRAISAAPDSMVQGVGGIQIVGEAAPEVGILPLIAALAPTVLPMLGQALGGMLGGGGGGAAPAQQQGAAQAPAQAPAGGGGGGLLGNLLGGVLGGLGGAKPAEGGGGGGGGGPLGGLGGMLGGMMGGGGGPLGGLMSMLPGGGMLPGMGGGGFPPMPHEMLGIPFPPMPHEMMMRAAGIGVPAGALPNVGPSASAIADADRVRDLQRQIDDLKRLQTEATAAAAAQQQRGGGRRRDSWDDTADYDVRPQIPWRRIRDYIDALVDNRADVVGLLRRGPSTLGAGALLSQADQFASVSPAVPPDTARLIRTAMRTVNTEAGRMLGAAGASEAMQRALQAGSANAEGKVARALHAAEALIGGP